MDISEYNKIVGTWVKGVLDNRGINAELTLKYCSDIAEFAQQTQDAKLLGFAYYYSGETYYGLNDGENMFRYITKAITYLNQAEQWGMIARAYNVMAITSLNRGNAPIAMDYYLTGLNYCKKFRLHREENMIHINLGSLYLYNGQYHEAQKYFELVGKYTKSGADADEYYTLMACVASGLGRCYLLRGMPDKVQECFAYIKQECWKYLQNTEQLCVLCFQAEYYHKTGRITLLGETIDEIHRKVDTNMPVMDIFEDFYGLCRLLLEIDNGEIFWDIVNIVETLAKNARLINLQRRIISLKIKYYRRHKDNEGYLQAAGLYYELTEVMERENQYMITNMLDVRYSLERANEMYREAERVNERLLEKSETDALSQLANRFRLNDFSEEAFERALAGGKGFAVEILDIDYFKEYNDNYGHQAGDDCIRIISEELRKMQDDSVFCARYGGDEFIIIYEEMAAAEVFAKAETLRQRILDRRIEHVCSRALPVVTISQGICYDIPGQEDRSWDYLHMADTMLYQVKKSSRNNISMGRLDGSRIDTGY